MYVYSREFPTKIIPHITEIGEINDNIHNYKRPKMKENNFVKKETKKEPKKDEILKQQLTMKTNTNKSLQDDEDEEYEKPRKAQKPQLALLAATPVITEAEIKEAINEITNEETAKLIGLICHLVYWSVFGHLNPLPLDKYHMKQLFISISQI